jgi:hypothetical protein
MTADLPLTQCRGAVFTSPAEFFFKEATEYEIGTNFLSYINM